jgi:hypothetical protein
MLGRGNIGQGSRWEGFWTAKCTNKKLLDSSGNEEVLDKKQRTLVAMGKVGMPVNGETARNVILGIIRALKPEMLTTPSGTNPNAPKFSLQVVRRFLRVDMDWSVRAGIQAAQKTPDDWEAVYTDTFWRIFWRIHQHQVHSSLVINIDQTQVYLIPCGNSKTYHPRGSKQVQIFGKEEKRAFTMLLGCITDGQLLPLQSVYTGKSALSLPRRPRRMYAEECGHTFAYGGLTYWSTMDTMKQYFSDSISKHREGMIELHNLPDDSKVILSLDCWGLHRSQELRDFVQTIPWLVLVYVPGGCTGLFQPCDVGIQRVFKHHIKAAAAEYFTSEIERIVGAGVAPEHIRPDISVGILRDQAPEWLVSAYD